MPDTIRVRIVHKNSELCSCGLLMERPGWPAVFLDFQITRQGDWVHGSIEAAGFGNVGVAECDSNSQQPLASGPLSCIGVPEAHLEFRPSANLTWAQAHQCQDLQIEVVRKPASIHRADA
jgi:hypothetical protein